MYFHFNWTDVIFKFKSVYTTSKFIKFDNSNFEAGHPARPTCHEATHPGNPDAKSF